MTPYEQGQIDLIAKIKRDVTKVLETSESYFVLADMIHLLKSIEPIVKGGL